MSWRDSVSLPLFLLLLLVGCGPSIASVGEIRVAHYPAREAGCSLEFVQLDIAQVSPGGPWEVVGYVTISETGIPDPFSEQYRQIVRPRACRMGGEAVTIMQTAMNQTAFQAGSGTMYGVLRPRRANTTPPQQF